MNNIEKLPMIHSYQEQGAVHYQNFGEKTNSFSINSKTQNPLASWNTKHGEAILEFNSDQELVAYSPSGKFRPISEMWMKGIPKGLKEDSKRLKQFLRETFVEIGSLGNGENTLHIHYRLNEWRVTDGGVTLEPNKIFPPF